MKSNRNPWGVVVARLTKADNLPYVVLGVLAALSLMSRAYLLTR